MLIFSEHLPRVETGTARTALFATKQDPEVSIMKSLVQAVAVAAVLSIPAVSFAQSNQPLTRAEVKAQLVQIEKAGYEPGRDDRSYPTDVLAAEARIASQNSAAASGYGGAVDTTSASAAPVHSAVGDNDRSVYNGH
jgi:hypothetical protein